MLFLERLRSRRFWAAAAAAQNRTAPAVAGKNSALKNSSDMDNTSLYFGLRTGKSYAGVIKMYYSNLTALVASSKSAGRFFFSLPVAAQTQLADCGTLIHTAAELHLYANLVEKHMQAVRLADSLTF